MPVHMMLFLVAWCIGVACFFLAIVEAVGMLCFWGWTFGMGVRIWQDRSSLHPPAAETGAIIETENGKFKVLAPTVCIFRIKMPTFGFHVHTPFPIKGTLRWDGNGSTIEGRIPIFTTLFLCTWLV